MKEIFISSYENPNFQNFKEKYEKATFVNGDDKSEER